MTLGRMDASEKWMIIRLRLHQTTTLPSLDVLPTTFLQFILAAMAKIALKVYIWSRYTARNKLTKKIWAFDILYVKSCHKNLLEEWMDY